MTKAPLPSFAAIVGLFIFNSKGRKNRMVNDVDYSAGQTNMFVFWVFFFFLEKMHESSPNRGLPI